MLFHGITFSGFKLYRTCVEYGREKAIHFVPFSIIHVIVNFVPSGCYSSNITEYRKIPPLG